MIDSGSSTNLVARRVVRDLLLPTELFAQPYQLAWITSGHEANVFERCLVHFVGTYYHDYVWCDVIPIMTACRLLLGRPWQFGGGVIHDGGDNSYTIHGENLVVTVFPKVVNGIGWVRSPNVQDNGDQESIISESQSIYGVRSGDYQNVKALSIQEDLLALTEHANSFWRDAQQLDTSYNHTVGSGFNHPGVTNSSSFVESHVIEKSNNVNIGFYRTDEKGNEVEKAAQEMTPRYEQELELSSSQVGADDADDANAIEDQVVDQTMKFIEAFERTLGV